MRLLSFLSAVTVVLAAGATAGAQTFLNAGYAGPAGKPTQLNVCGDGDVAAYRVSREPGAPTASELVATVHLFEGVRAVGLDPLRSSPGVSVVSLDDPSRPVLSLPDVGTANASVDFALVLEARCGLLDTITANNLVEVRDSLAFTFTAVGQPRAEGYAIDPYLGAVTFPVVTIATSLERSPVRVGEVVRRRVELSNGSFLGYADTLRYALEQGPGVTLLGIDVNGVARPFGKTVTPAGDTLVELVLAGEDFRGNLRGGGSGDGDTRLDPDERVVITETVRVRDCGTARLARHTTRFGCDGGACATESVRSDLPIGSGQPELRISRASTFPDVEVGYCQLGELTLEVRNLGRESDPTFGEARDIAVSALASFGDLLSANNYRIERVEVAGRPLPSLAPVVALDTVAAFATDPDGVGVGLEDLDGDGVFDDLALLEAFELKVFYAFDCTSSATYDLDEHCANDAATTLQAFVYFDDACGRRIRGSEPSVYSPRNLQDAFEQRTQPDADAAGAPFRVELEFGRLVFNFANACRDDGELRAYVVLPSGVTVDPGTCALSRGSTVGLPLLGVTYRSDTAVLRFDPSAEPALAGEYTLTLGMSADCSAPLGETVYPTTVAYYCPTCDCEHVWICEELIGPWIHKSAPPCQVADLYPCPRGVQGTRFQIDRTTLGFADPDFATPIAPAAANTKVALPADSVLVQIDGTVGDAVVGDGLGVIIHYYAPDGVLDTAGLFLLDGGTLEWDDGGTTRTCALGRIPHTLENDPVDVDETWQRFDLSACLRDNGWSVRPGDAIRFRGRFEVNPAGPITDQYAFVDDLRGGFYALDDAGAETLCEQYGDVFRVGRPLAIFGTPSNDQFPKGCQASQLSFKLTSVNRGYAREFGPEYRRAARLDSLIITFDPALLSAFGDLRAELFVAGHPTQGSTYFPVRPLSDFPDGRYVLQLDTLDYAAELVTNHTQLYDLRLTLAPNCSSIRSSSSGDQFYAMTSSPYFRDRYYARDIGDGSGVDAVEDPRAFVLTYEDPATLRMDQLTPAYQRIGSDSALVRIEVCNTSTVADAGRSWLTFDDTTDLTVEAVRLLDDADAPRVLAIEPYAGGHFVNVEGLSRVNGINATAQVCNLLEVEVRTSACQARSLVFASGWACEATAPPGWTPDRDAACVDDQVLSTLEPIGPFLEVALTTQPTSAVPLCERITMDFQVNNAEPGTSYDIVSQFYLPEGFDYVPGSAQVAYPPQAPFEATAAEPGETPATIRGRGLAFGDLAAVHPFLGANGLPGFDPTAPDDSSRYVIRLAFETDCDFRSGSLVFFEAEGVEACGDRTNLAATESASIVIDGAAPSGTHLFEVGLEASVRTNAGEDSGFLEVVVVNAGTEAADPDDVVVVTLPAGLRYEPGTAQGILPTGYAPGEPALSLLGEVQLAEFGLPPGLAPGATARLRFAVRADGPLTCEGALEAAVAVNRYLMAGCTNPSVSCRIPTDVTVGGQRFEPLPFGPRFAAEELVNTAACAGAGAERLDLRVVLRPVGFALGGRPLPVELYYDANGNARVDAGDELLDTQSLPTAAGSAEVVYAYDEVLGRDRLGALYLLVDSAGTGLCRPQAIPLTLPRLDNADTTAAYRLCVNESARVTLGTTVCAGDPDVAYSWTSLPTGFEALLDDATVAMPTASFPDPYRGPDTVRFVLASERPGLGRTTDTATVIVSPGVALGPDTERTIAPGAAIFLQPGVELGSPPLTYRWSPPTGLDDPEAAQPRAQPAATTTYVLTVADAAGCSDSNRHTVTVAEEIDATASVTDTTLCPGETAELAVMGGLEVAWVADARNPPEGGLRPVAGPNVTFDPAGGVGLYRYVATVTDPASPGLSDTVGIRITVAPFGVGRCAELVWRDTILLGDVGARCFTAEEIGLPGDGLTVVNACPEGSGAAVDFLVDEATACVDYDGLAVGRDTACLEFCNALGSCVPGRLIVTVVPVAKVTVFDTVFVNQEKAYCVDPLLGEWTLLRYPDLILEGGVGSLGACVTYRGLELGTDRIDLVAVADGRATPVCVVVTVVPYAGGVTVLSDSTCTQRNLPVRLNVLANDTVYGGVASFEIVTPPDPSDGDLVVNADNTVTFTPADGVCSRDVTLVYEVCNGNRNAPGGGCGQGVVTICIECDPLTIFTAVTPNGDGKNETFWIERIEEFPDNRLQIFNRWGNLVYEERGYLNDWSGTYNGDPLPDGAYFYILDVADGGTETTYNGYVEIVN